MQASLKRTLFCSIVLLTVALVAGCVAIPPAPASPKPPSASYAAAAPVAQADAVIVEKELASAITGTQNLGSEAQILVELGSGEHGAPVYSLNIEVPDAFRRGTLGDESIGVYTSVKEFDAQNLCGGENLCVELDDQLMNFVQLPNESPFAAFLTTTLPYSPSLSVWTDAPMSDLSVASCANIAGSFVAEDGTTYDMVTLAASTGGGCQPTPACSPWPMCLLKNEVQPLADSSPLAALLKSRFSNLQPGFVVYQYPGADPGEVASCAMVAGSALDANGTQYDLVAFVREDGNVCPESPQTSPKTTYCLVLPWLPECRD